MATRRSRRVTGKKLSNDFDKIIARSKAQVRRETATATRRSTRTSGNKLANGPLSLQEFQARLTQTFRLLDLPPELREFIYAYATATAYARELGGVKLPTLALVSKQIRAEVLPQFFAQELHVGHVVSNYTQIKFMERRRNLLHNADAVQREGLSVGDEKERKNNGYFISAKSSKATIERLREREQFVPLFRTVQLKAYSGYRAPQDTHTIVERATFVLSVPTKRVLRPQVTLVGPDGGSSYPEELARLLARVRTKVEEVAKSRETFLGFTFEDLEAIAKEFCFCYDSI
ncbi:hypothetical protein LTS10_012178 [Elasticomyces elasticus]|nr:hypothetical protein LTS10_012178 [Elasticomyces elasticus]